ncbi:MAG: 2-dehydropantoate 2-reductase [Oscillospiraceae bacterium]|nr:2-dehydropantoate 2-reductase [Oscillospiraceae bacterium]
MKYLIIGTGGIGGALGGFLANEGYDVTLIARGAHLAAIKENGLKLKSGIKGEITVKAKACTAEEYNETPDVIFVCVKGYSLDDAESLIAKCAGENTVVIPLLNIFGTGSELQRRLPDAHVLDGCIYITSYISAPGEITQGGKLFKIVFGERDGSKSEQLEKIAEELVSCGIRAELTDDIRRLCFKKYALISSMAAVGCYYDANMGEVCADPSKKEFFIGLSKEIDALASAMGIPFEDDIVAKNLHMIETAAPETTASVQKDLAKGGKSELEGLVYEPVRLGKQQNVATPNFAKVAEKFGFEI